MERPRLARADIVPTVLRERPRARVDGGWVRRLGEGDVPGALLDVFGLGSGAGRVCAVCAAEALVCMLAHCWCTTGSIEFLAGAFIMIVSTLLILIQFN